MNAQRTQVDHLHIFGRLLAILTMTMALLAIPVRTYAADIAYDPLWIDFGQVPFGETAEQTLTLTNLDDAELISVSEIVFTFNLGNQFSWSTDKPLPFDIFPSESKVVTFRFTPTMESFSSADVWIYSNADNYPSLYYQLSGEGVLMDPCYPLTSCGAECADLLTDEAHCGACFNVCEAVANGTVECIDGGCTFTCNEGYEPVGDTCVLIGPQDPLAMLQNLIAYAEASIEDGSLVGFFPGTQGPDRLSTFMRMLDGLEITNPFGQVVELDGAVDYLAADKIESAWRLLDKAQLGCDGGWPFTLPPDYVAGDAAYVIHAGLLEIMQALQEQYPDLNLVISEPITRPQR